MTTEKKQRLAPSVRVSSFVIAAAVVLADQISKIAIAKTLGVTGNSVTVIPGVLDFEYTLNSGATAGMLSQHRWVFMAASTVVIIALSVYLALGRASNRLTAVTLGVILGGGIGNMIDRVVNGTVVDFIHVTCLPFFPFTTVFNVADIGVSVGCVLLLICVIAGEFRDRRSGGAGSSDKAAAPAVTTPEDTDGE